MININYIRNILVEKGRKRGGGGQNDKNVRCEILCDINTFIYQLLAIILRNYKEAFHYQR